MDTDKETTINHQFYSYNNLKDFNFKIKENSEINFRLHFNHELLKKENLKLNLKLFECVINLIDNAIDTDELEFFRPGLFTKSSGINHCCFDFNHYTKIILYFSLYEVIDDQGLIFSSIKNMSNFHKKSHSRLAKKYIREEGIVYLDLNFNIIKVQYNRVYKKLQNVFADIGGIFSSILLIGKMLVYFFNTKFFYLQSINFLFMATENDVLTLHLQEKCKKEFYEALKSNSTKNDSIKCNNTKNNFNNKFSKNYIRDYKQKAFKSYLDATLNFAEENKIAANLNNENLAQDSTLPGIQSVNCKDLENKFIMEMDNFELSQTNLNIKNKPVYENDVINVNLNKYKQQDVAANSIRNFSQLKNRNDQKCDSLNKKYLNEINIHTNNLSSNRHLTNNNHSVINNYSLTYNSSILNECRIPEGKLNKISYCPQKNLITEFKEKENILNKKIKDLMLFHQKGDNNTLNYLKRNENTQKKLINLSNFELILSLICCTKIKKSALINKEVIFAKAEKRIIEYLNVLNYFDLFEDFEKLKFILLNENQNFSFYFLRKRSLDEISHIGLDEKISKAINYYKAKINFFSSIDEKLIDNFSENILKLVI